MKIESNLVFSTYPDMESFGWHQCSKRWVDGRDVVFEESLKKPNISGALGEFYIDPDGRQKAVAMLLASYPIQSFEQAFGDGVDIAVYKDGSIEITDDTYRPLVYEF
ncbi:hypothetical protein [Acinetobacter sp.]|uniref:hypothetical protein n=1 Tax=Acinetobacter sp. TaxID=472 RepID=UPI003751850D